MIFNNIGSFWRNFSKFQFLNKNNMYHYVITTGRTIFLALLPVLILALVQCAGVPGREPSGAAKLVGVTSGEPVVPRHANTIFVPDFIDTTGRSGIARRLTLKVRDLIGRDGRLAVTPAREGADLLLEGDITGFQIQPIEYGGQGVPLRKRMRIVVSVKLLDLGNGRIIFRDRSVQSFMVYSEIRPPVMSEHQVLDSLLETLAERIRAQTITGWYTEYMSSVEKGKK